MASADTPAIISGKWKDIGQSNASNNHRKCRTARGVIRKRDFDCECANKRFSKVRLLNSCRPGRPLRFEVNSDAV